jgi:branched-chain amino acid aminotransferase
MTIQSVSNDTTENPNFLWRNGECVKWKSASIHVNAVGHASVAGIFEGLKAYRDASSKQIFLFRLQDHMERFLESARLVRLRLNYKRDELSDATIELLRRNDTHQDTYVRPYCFARGIVRQLMVPADIDTETVIDSWPFQSSLGTLKTCRATVSSWARTDDRIAPPRIKAFSNYHNSRFAQLEATRNGYDTSIMLDARGKVSEGPAACLFMTKRDRLVTPTVTSSILESITRDTMITLAKEELELEVDEREIDRSELHLADEIFFVGTGWEIMPVVELDGMQVGDGMVGPIAQNLDKKYTQIVRGQAKDQRSWITPVWP